MVDQDPAHPKRRKPWALTFFGFLAACGLISMPIIAGAPSDRMSDMVRFLGHFHPVLLHLPIGVFALILMQESRAIFFTRGNSDRDDSLFPLMFGAASAIVAVLAGFLLYHGHGEEYAGNALAERHLWGGLIFAVAAVITFIWKAWTVSLRGNPAFYRVLLFASVGVMGFTSHDGASMTHGSDFLTAYAPEPLKRLMGTSDAKKKPVKSDAEPVTSEPGLLVYQDVVAPIFERRCVQCHKESKAKGKFRMDTFELLVKGGKEGPGLEPGKSAESNIIIRIELPEDDEEHMPPEGKVDIEDAEVAIIKWWIDAGADPKASLAEMEVPAAIKEAIGKLAPAGAKGSAEDSEGHPEATKAPDDALKAKVADILKEFPGALAFESQQSAGLTFTAVSMAATLDDVQMKKIEPVVSSLIAVDLSKTKITDAGIAVLGPAKKLRMIRLSETAVTDAALDTLLTLTELESINLYATKVTDAGVTCVCHK